MQLFLFPNKAFFWMLCVNFRNTIVLLVVCPLRNAFVLINSNSKGVCPVLVSCFCYFGGPLALLLFSCTFCFSFLVKIIGGEKAWNVWKPFSCDVISVFIAPFGSQKRGFRGPHFFQNNFTVLVLCACGDMCFIICRLLKFLLVLWMCSLMSHPGLIFHSFLSLDKLSKNSWMACLEHLQ